MNLCGTNVLWVNTIAVLSNIFFRLQSLLIADVPYGVVNAGSKEDQWPYKIITLQKIIPKHYEVFPMSKVNNIYVYIHFLRGQRATLSF